MKYRYRITVMIGVIDISTQLPVIPNEQFIAIYDAPTELNLINPVDQALLKRVARITFENMLLEENRLVQLGLLQTDVQITYFDPQFVKQIRRKNDPAE